MARRPPPTKTPEKATPPKVEAEGRSHHTTTVRLSDEAYRRLRLFITTREQKTGERLTHQTFFERAMDDYLKKNGGD